MNDLAGKSLEAMKILFKHFEISVDVHEKQGSWAVISAQGEKRTLIKFIDLSDKHIQEIAAFLKNFERKKIDANPQVKGWIDVNIN